MNVSGNAVTVPAKTSPIWNMSTLVLVSTMHYHHCHTLVGGPASSDQTTRHHEHATDIGDGKSMDGDNRSRQFEN